MKMKAHSLLYPLPLVIVLFGVLGCGPDEPVVHGACPPGSEADEFNVWFDNVSIYPRSSAKELIDSAFWQGVDHTMSRREVETVLAPYLRARQLNSSEFETPLGRVRWSLDHEVSGGDEARIPRIYLYPRKLFLGDVLAAEVVDCLRKAAPKAKYVVVMGGQDRDQRATIVVEGLTIKKVVWQQTRL